MLELELLEEEGDFVQLTLLGRACGRSALSFESSMRLVELLRQHRPDQLTAEKLIAVLQALPESDGGYTPIMKRGSKESVWPGVAASRYGEDIIRALQRFVDGQFGYFARCKRAAILGDWISGVSMEELEKKYTATPFQGRIGHGDVRRFADATRFHLRSAHDIVGIMLIGRGPDAESVERVLRQLEVGIPEECLELLGLPIPLGRGEYLALHNSGVNTPRDLWALPSERLSQILGHSRAEQLLGLRPRGLQ